MKVPTKDVARGKWKGILATLGVSIDHLTGKHGPCPMCGGTDRFRFDNKGGDGTYFCSQCGAGNGFDLLRGVNSWDFSKAASEVDRVVGNIAAETPARQMDEAQRRDMLNRLWKGAATIRSDNPAARYLGSRNLNLPQNAGCLRYADRCPIPGGGFSPAMLAMVTNADGSPCNIHRTFVRPDGSGKADMSEPRALMPGRITDGAAIRLASVHGERLGIAEGIETALAAAQRFNIPTWAAINSTILAKWQPPAGVREVVIFGDNDPKFGGAAAAFALAHRLAVKGFAVDVRIPEQVGKDWADVAA